MLRCTRSAGDRARPAHKQFGRQGWQHEPPAPERPRARRSLVFCGCGSISLGAAHGLIIQQTDPQPSSVTAPRCPAGWRPLQRPAALQGALPVPLWPRWAALVQQRAWAVCLFRLVASPWCMGPPGMAGLQARPPGSNDSMPYCLCLPACLVACLTVLACLPLPACPPSGGR